MLHEDKVGNFYRSFIATKVSGFGLGAWTLSFGSIWGELSRAWTILQSVPLLQKLVHCLQHAFLVKLVSNLHNLLFLWLGFSKVLYSSMSTDNSKYDFLLLEKIFSCNPKVYHGDSEAGRIEKFRELLGLTGFQLSDVFQGNKNCRRIVLIKWRSPLD